MDHPSRLVLLAEDNNDEYVTFLRAINNQPGGYTYGSDMRDQAMVLETLTLLGKRSLASELVTSLSADLSIRLYII